MTTTLPPLLHSFSDFAAWREARDTRLRTRLGGAYYLLAWMLCWGFSAAPLQLAVPGAVLWIFYAGMLAWRSLDRLPASDDARVLRRWLSQHWLLIFGTALAWGLTYAWILLQPDFRTSWLIATLATVAFATAMAFTFPMDRQRAILATCLLLVPAFAAMAAVGREHLPTLVTLAFYTTYLMLALKRGHAEYWAHARTEYELYEQRARFQEMSRTDSLTQLGNRYHFNSRFPVLAAQAAEEGRPLSLLLFDLDFFKQVNDAHGHAAGDACLRSFAEALRNRFGTAGNALARLGGEEFAVLMPATPADEAYRRAEAFRDEVAALRIEAPGRVLQLTTSVGVGTLSGAPVEPSAFFQQVDRALYRAKENGRNRSAVAGDADAAVGSAGSGTGPDAAA